MAVLSVVSSASALETLLAAWGRDVSRGPAKRPLAGPLASVAEPGALIGIEQEFTLNGRGPADAERRLIPFAELFDAVRAAAGATVAHSVPPGVHLDDGTLVTIDGREAEIAIAPLAGSAAGVGTVAARVRAAQARFYGLLASVADSLGVQDLTVRGYSTHISIACPFVDLRLLSRRYVETVAPAMMLMLDLPCSPGLIVRPRSLRLEIGGDYCPPDDRLTAAVTFAGASTLALIDAMSDGTPALPLRFAPRIEACEQRPGWFVARDAFGDDLYLLGRRAMLTTEEGPRISAQDALARSWAWCRGHAIARFGGEAAALVDAAVAGTRPLPCETENLERDVLPLLSANTAQSATDPQGADDDATAFAALVSGIRVADLKLVLDSSGWHRAIVRCERGGIATRHEIRRTHLALLAAAAREGTLAAMLDVTDASNGPLAAYATSAEPFVAASPPAEMLTESRTAARPPSSALSKKKREDDICAARLVAEGDSSHRPTVEACVPRTSDTLVPRKLQEPPVGAWRGGEGLFLHNGGAGHEQADLRVKAIGFDFVFQRFYRSFIEHDGPMGLRWDHGYNQRVVPTRPFGARTIDDGWCEIYDGPETSRSGDLFYYSGTGRRTFHRSQAGITAPCARSISPATWSTSVPWSRSTRAIPASAALSSATPSTMARVRGASPSSTFAAATTALCRCSTATAL